MIELINELLLAHDFINVTENINIAKGKYELKTSFREAFKQLKRYDRKGN